MKRIINVITILAAVITSILIVCTLLTSYQFLFVGQIFYSYKPIQISVAVTMALLSLRFWINESGRRKLIYSGFSLFMCIFLLLSINFVK